MLEGPNTDIDRLIRSVAQGRQGKVSNALAKEFPAQADTDIAQHVVSAVRKAFADDRAEEKAGPADRQAG